MSCQKKRRYYLLSQDEQRFYGYNDIGDPGWVDNLPWSHPYLLRSVTRARRLAEKVGGTVRYYPGFVRTDDLAEDTE